MSTWGLMMRNFIILGHRALTEPNFSLNDLPGTGGRVDILARCINSAFQLSHTIRRDVEVAVVLLGPTNPPKTIRFVGLELKYLNPDERSTGALIRNALVKSSARNSNSQTPQKRYNKTPQEAKLKFPNEIVSSPGVYISDLGFEELLNHYSENSIMIHLNEIGSEIHEKVDEFENDDKDLTFILSDHLDFSDDELRIVDQHKNLEMSLGPNSLHSDQCIVLVHNLLDNLSNRK
jgi:tRNA (pseudouridine54-N1)-methyltransferase